MSDFDTYWAEKQAEYLKIAKNLALQDFLKIQEKSNFVAHINIDSDDDFQLDSGLNLTAKGNTKKEAIENIIKQLKEAKLTYVNGATVINGQVSQNYSKAEAWFSIRDYAIKQFNRGNTNFTYGGNHVIEGYVIENTLHLDTLEKFDDSPKKKKRTP